MGRTPWATYLWPGLPQLWKRGSWSALGVAFGFALLLDLAVVGTLLWSEILAPDVRTVTWAATGAAWIASVLYTAVWDRRTAGPVSAPGEDYPDALDHYLKGNWFESERILARLLGRDPRDLEARLLRATLFRRTGRHQEAAHELDKLERFEGVERWALEISRERQALATARSEQDAPQDGGSESAATIAAGPPKTPEQAA